MTIFVSDEVLENRRLANEQPEVFRLAHSADVWCQNSNCDNRLEVFAKNADSIVWYCGECEACDDASCPTCDDASDAFPLWLEHDEGE